MEDREFNVDEMDKLIKIERKGLLGTMVIPDGARGYHLQSTKGYPISWLKEVLWENWDTIYLASWIRFCKENKRAWWLPIMIFINKLKWRIRVWIKK